jgi:Rad3-related DNA helicase
MRDGKKEYGINPDPRYLDRVTFTTVIQQYGRVMRCPDDWGYTFILDQSMVKTLAHMVRDKQKIEELNIDYFIEAIQLDQNGRFQQAF